MAYDESTPLDWQCKLCGKTRGDGAQFRTNGKGYRHRTCGACESKRAGARMNDPVKRERRNQLRREARARNDPAVVRERERQREKRNADRAVERATRPPVERSPKPKPATPREGSDERVGVFSGPPGLLRQRLKERRAQQS